MKEDFEQSATPPSATAQKLAEKDPNVSAEGLNLNALEDARLRDFTAPENIASFTKATAFGAPAHLIMTQRSLEALGGYENMERLFFGSVDEPQLIWMITDADLKYAKSNEYKKPEETDTEAFVRYLGEEFQNTFAEWDDGDTENDLSREEELEIWKALTSNSNYNLHLPSNKVKIVSLNLEIFFEKFSNIKGSRQQAIDYLVGHELDHGDNVTSIKNDPMRIYGELASDTTGVSVISDEPHPLAFWKRGVSQEKFMDSVKVQRIENQLANMAQGELGYISYGRRFWTHSVGLFLEGTDPSDVELPENYEGLLQEFETVIEGGADKVPEILARNIDVPHNIAEMVNQNETLAAIFASEFYENILDMMESADLLTKDEGHVYWINLYDAEDEGNTKEFHKILKEVRAENPEFFDAALENQILHRVFDWMDPLAEELGMSDAEYEQWENELEALENIEELYARMVAENEFFFNTLKRSDGFFQAYFFEENKDIIFSIVQELDREVFSRSMTEFAGVILIDNPDLNPQIRDALEEYIKNSDYTPRSVRNFDYGIPSQ